jgi:hypothetical protein
MNRHAEVLGQGGGNNRRKCPFGPGDLSVQRCLERGWNGGIEICHQSSPTGLNQPFHNIIPLRPWGLLCLCRDTMPEAGLSNEET